MMLIIADKSSYKAVEWLIENTNKQFVWKQLLELGQLICSTDISSVYKPVKQGVALQEFILKHIEWIYYYYENLYVWCKNNIKMQQRTKTKISEIRADIFLKCEIYKKKHKRICDGNRVGFELELAPIKYDLDTAIWRYSKEYKSEYETNSELPIEVVTELYKRYITEFKFAKEMESARV